MEINEKTAHQLRLTSEEFDLITQKLGRTPNFTELCAFSGMWSEHCSYKNSVKWLKTLPREGSKMLVKAGEENAGIMDIGDGLGVVFKIESHNHPSAIEPFQGAATGVGGIHRDIFTMGARPIAALNSLRFGNLEEEKTQHLLAGVVRGIGHYGNCFGVPTVGGEIYFEDCYHTNPLVNAMSVGIVKLGETVSATAAGKGNPVMYVGSATGRDGIGGASFASADITAESTEELPAVQVGDPFQEKKLLEACLEIIATGAVVGMQDMGAAGIICSTAEMSAKGEVGMRIYLDKVPTRVHHANKDEGGMKAWELLLSESQERMLLVVEKGREEEVEKIFDKWDLERAVIGEVTDDKLLSFYLHGSLEAQIPAYELVLGGGAPQYERAFKTPAYFDEINKFDIKYIPEPDDLRTVAEKLIQLPSVASKRWIYHQYDSMVGTVNASTNEPSDAAVVYVKEFPHHAGQAGKGMAITVDCNSRYVYSDPYKGTMIAVAEAARNIVCSGGKPLGITNCLNFGNPFDPEVYYQFVHAVKGMGDAGRKFGTPVTGGNVSFYNQGPDGPVYPTPTIGMVGLIDDLNKKMTLDFKKPGDIIYLLGSGRNDINSSEYLHKICGTQYSPPPYFDLEEEIILHQKLSTLIQEGIIKSAHDVSEGGLFVTLCESGFNRDLGFDVYSPLALPTGQAGFGEGPVLRSDAILFGEGQTRVVVTIADNENTIEQFKGFMTGFPTEKIGVVKTGSIIIFDENWGSIKSWKKLYDTAIDKYLPKELKSEGALEML